MTCRGHGRRGFGGKKGGKEGKREEGNRSILP